MSQELSKKLTFTLLLVATMGVMSGVTVVSSIPLMSKTFADIPHIEFLSKMMLTIPSIVIAVLAPFVGIIVDRFGRMKPLYAGVLLFTVAGSSGFYLDNFYAILVGRALLGVSIALLMTSQTALVGDYFDKEERHKFMALQGMSIALGGIIFITSGGFLAEIHWSYPFIIYTLPLLFLPIMLKTLYEPERSVKTPENSTEIPIRLWPIYLTGFSSMVIFYMIPTQLPYLVIDTLNGTPKTIGFLISVAMLFNAVTSKQYAKIKKKLSYKEIYMITFVFFGIGLFLISQVNTIAHLYFAMAFIGIGFGLILVNTNAWFISTVPANKRGRASGLLGSSFFMGQFASPLLFQPLVHNYGIQGLFFIISVISLTAALWLFLSDQRNPKR